MRSVVVFEYRDRETFINDKPCSVYQCLINDIHNFIKVDYWYKLIALNVKIVRVKLFGLRFDIPHYLFTRIHSNSLRISSCVLKHIFGISKIIINNVDYEEAIKLIKNYLNCSTVKDIEKYLKNLRKYSINILRSDVII